MTPITPDRIRNVALISHGGAGKTSLAEAMLFDAGAIARLGSVDAGTATLDYDPDEEKRKQSINLAVGTLEADGVRITLVDTPGYADFQADVVQALAAVDAAVVVVDASAGVETGTEEVWRLAEERRLPRFVFVNKMDRENANYDAVLAQLKAKFGPKIAPVYLPIGSAGTFRGYIDVIEQHANVYEGGKPKEVPIPEELAAGEASRRESLVEAAAEASDELMMKYLESEPFSDEEIEAALHKGTREGSVVPVFVGSATENIGVRELITMISRHIPSPAETGARVATGWDPYRTRPERRVRGTGLQDHRGSLRRPPHLLPGHLRHAPAAGAHLERHPARGRADRQHPGPAGQGADEPAAGRSRRDRRGCQDDQHADRGHADRRPGTYA